MVFWTPASGTDATAGPRPLADPDGVRAPSPLAADLGLATRGSSLWRDGVRRLRRNRLAMAGGAGIVVLCFIAIFADVLAPLPYTKTNFGRLNEAPTRDYPLGTDQLGRDLLSRMIYGAPVSMLVGPAAQLIVVSIGVPIGALSGYVGGRTDLFLTRFIDVMYAFPRLLFVILVMSMLGAGLTNIFIAIGLTGWVGIARQTRAQVLAIKEKEFVDGARALGAGFGRLLTRHILPNALTPIVVAVTFGIPEAIFTQAAPPRRCRAARFLESGRRAGDDGRGGLQRASRLGGAQARPRREAGPRAARTDRRWRLVAERPLQPRLQQGPVLHRCARALGRPDEVQRRLPARPLRGEPRDVQRRRLGVDLYDPQGLQVVGWLPVHGARFRVVVEAPDGSGEQEPVLQLLLRHQGRRAIQQEQGAGGLPGRRARQGRLDARGDARGAAGILPGAVGVPRGASRSPALGREARRQVDGGRQHRLQRALCARDVGAQQSHGAAPEQALHRRQGRDAGQGDDPHRPGAVRGPAVREQRARHLAAADGRSQATARRSPDREASVPVSVPRHLVLDPAGDEAALRQCEGAPGGGARRRPGERGEGG